MGAHLPHDLLDRAEDLLHLVLEKQHLHVPMQGCGEGKHVQHLRDGVRDSVRVRGEVRVKTLGRTRLRVRVRLVRVRVRMRVSVSVRVKVSGRVKVRRSARIRERVGARVRLGVRVRGGGRVWVRACQAPSRGGRRWCRLRRHLRSAPNDYTRNTPAFDALTGEGSGGE